MGNKFMVDALQVPDDKVLIATIPAPFKYTLGIQEWAYAVVLRALCAPSTG
jgi:hypothetical protein